MSIAMHRDPDHYFMALQDEGTARLSPFSSVVLHANFVSMSFDVDIYSGQRLSSKCILHMPASPRISISSCITTCFFDRFLFILRTQHHEVNSRP